VRVKCHIYGVLNSVAVTVKNYSKTMLRFVCLLWIIFLSFAEAEHTDLIGDHICYDQELQEKVINTTYLVAVQVRKYKPCFNIPPKCAYYETQMETRWKPENISRMVNIESCCPGYESRDGRCHPSCTRPCVNGVCSKPGTCTCTSGFSGPQCDVIGCSGGRWGPNCKEDCKCKNGGHCHHSTGACTCPPGYQGLECQNKCSVGRFGSDCSGKCTCAVGHQCHFVTGDCTPCTTGSWGKNCANNCAHCDKKGTALCGHVDGRCYCQANRFGSSCELTCPFGFINSTCYTAPVNLKCLCPNDLYTCDLVKGCVCPGGKDCGLEVIGQVEVASLSGFSVGGGEDTVSHSSAVYAICALLVIGAVAAILIVVYYRRRLKVMRKDLNNRSVYYVENGVVGDNRHHDLIVTNRDPLDQEDVPIAATASQSYQAAANNHLDMLPNNARVSFRTKNVNIDNYKLGLESQKFPQTQCVALGAEGTSCQAALAEDTGEDVVEENVVVEPEDEININLYTELDTKNNAAMARLYGKEGKKDLEFIIRNNLGEVKDKEEEDVDLCGAEAGNACGGGVVNLPPEKGRKK